MNWIDPYGLQVATEYILVWTLVVVGTYVTYQCTKDGLEKLVHEITKLVPEYYYLSSEEEAAGEEAAAEEGKNEGDKPGRQRANSPAKGDPNSSVVIDYGTGSVTERFYGEDGLADVDIDYGHDHTGQGDPHFHPWDWGKDSPRGDPQSLPTR